MAIRKELNLFANIRPVRIFDALKHLSPLKPERIEGVDFVVVRELTGGIYFGEHILEEDKARDINDYSADEIRRIMRRAFKIAQGRGKRSLALINKMFWQLLNCGVRLLMKFLWSFQM